jgi:hypothetical protein
MDYLASLNDKQKVAFAIAQAQLKSSYTMTKSNGYLKYLSTLPPPPQAPPYAGR